jgi:serralysin
MAYQTSTTPGSGYGSPYVDSLVWGCQWSNVPSAFGPAGVSSPVNVTYSFGSGLMPSWPANASNVGVGWLSSEMSAAQAAFQLYSNVCNVTFTQTSYSPIYANQSNIVMYLVPSSHWGSSSILGEFEPPDGSYSSNYGYFNYQNSTWNNLNQGSYGFITLVHEIGHGLGLAHPHDGGSGDSPTTFPGVTSPSSTGAYGLNQGIWTVMTYVGGWNQQPSSSYNYGWSSTPMAFDVAALQSIYGANTNYQTGVNTYLLPTSNASGTSWSCIWDAGGVDTISNATGSTACTINLNAAPLTGPNAGGYVSWALGVVGGYTIANGVVIENAIGGSGNDSITGNAAANTLNGGAGADTMMGGAGNDTYYVDVTSDVVTESSPGGTADKVYSSCSYTLGSSSYIEYLYLTGSSAINATGNALANVLTGNAAANTLNGGLGTDTLYGGLGQDFLYGGSDTVRDIFDFNAIAESKVGSTRDKIYNFVTGKDDVDLSGIDANSRSSGDQAFKFGGTTKTANGVWYEKSGADLLVHADINGDKVSDMDIQLVGVSKLVAADFVL